MQLYRNYNSCEEEADGPRFSIQLDRKCGAIVSNSWSRWPACPRVAVRKSGSPSQSFGQVMKPRLPRGFVKAYWHCLPTSG